MVSVFIHSSHDHTAIITFRLTVYHSYWKDAIVALSVTLCVGGLVYAWRKTRNASVEINKFLVSINDYEMELNKLRSQ